MENKLPFNFTFESSLVEESSDVAIWLAEAVALVQDELEEDARRTLQAWEEISEVIWPAEKK